MVIQRWQSVYLLVAAVLMAVYAFLPVASFSFEGISYELSLLGIEPVTPVGSPVIGVVTTAPVVMSWPLFVLSLLSAVLSVVTIFKFRQMKLQKTLCRVGIVLVVALIVSVYLLANGWPGVRFFLANCMPFLAIVALWMAARGIAADQKKLSESDRLR